MPRRCWRKLSWELVASQMANMQIGFKGEMKMIELTIADMFLLGWAIVATLGWMKSNDNLRGASNLIHVLLNDKTAREGILKHHEEFMRQREG
jgi:hypothetical protein